jgi:NhaP-type Na+/H+ or K+/H+ antiporter
MHGNTMLTMAGVLAVGMLCQWIAWRIKLPAILPLLAAGFLAGPIFNVLHPQAALGELFFPLISLSVAIILFEGALTLTWRDVRSVAGTVRNLITISALITWVGGALAARYLMGLPWDLSLLFGALIIVTGPTVIAPLIRNVRPTAKVSSVLRWEGILIDPVGATVAVLVFDFIIAGQGATWGHMAAILFWVIVVGTGLGLLGGWVVYQLLHRYLLPDYLRDTTTLALVLLIFALSNTFAAESGLLAVTVMGVYLANTDLVKLRELFYFKEKISIILISTLFILLAASITQADLALLNWASLGVLGVVILVLRPLGILIGARGSELNRNERLFLSWVAPRGIVAAAVSSLFAFELVEAGYPEARIVAPLTFLIIVGTVVLQGGTAKWVAQRLGVSEADPQGFLLMGANPLAQEIGLALQKAGVKVRLMDTNPFNVTQARLRGLDAQTGNLLSNFVEDEIDLVGIGRLLALTNNDEANALACKQFEDEFGSSQVYQLPPHAVRGSEELNRPHLGRLAFGKTATFPMLARMVEAGAKIRATPLTPQFTSEHFAEKYHDHEVISLFTARNGKIEVGTVAAPLQPAAGVTLFSLVRAPQVQPQPTVSAVPATNDGQTAPADYWQT